MNKLATLFLSAACFTASAQIEVDFSQGEDVAWVTYCNETIVFSNDESQSFWTQYRAMKVQISDLKKKKRVKEAALLNPFIASGLYNLIISRIKLNFELLNFFQKLIILMNFYNNTLENSFLGTQILPSQS